MKGTFMTKRKKIAIWLAVIGGSAVGIPFALLLGKVSVGSIGYLSLCLGIIVAAVSIYLDSTETTEKDKKMYIITSIVTLLVIIFFSGFEGGCFSSTNSNKTYTCKICHRVFEGGTSNSKSIINRNMCSQCYKNYQWANGD